MNINYLKLAIKTELKWLFSAKKSLFLTTMSVTLPLMIYIPGYASPDVEWELIANLLMLFSIAACYGQFFLDSTYNDINNNINIFFSNLNIPRFYLFAAKIIICIPFFLLLMVFSLFLKFKISILSMSSLITYAINAILYTYLIATYFFNKKSIFISMYMPIIFSLTLAYFSASFGMIISTLLLQLLFILIGIFLIKKMFKSKIITIKMFQ
jgi:hypothetical protein